MCEAVIFSMQGVVSKVYFAQKEARLPVKGADGQAKLVIWGRREYESGHLPIGGLANHKALRQGRWDKFFPINVKILVNEFMLRELSTGLINWYSLNPTQFVHGIIAREGEEQRLYVVAIERELNAYNGSWPRVLIDNR